MTDKNRENVELEKIDALVSDLSGMFENFLSGMQKIADDPELSAQFMKELEDSYRKAR